MPDTLAAGETIKREFRSTWMATVWGIDWPGTAGHGTTDAIKTKQKALLTDYVEKFANTNFTGICFQARARADALYSSSVAPWSSEITGTRGTNPGWDPLAYAVEQCHKNGIECYAWINPYRWSTSSTDWSTSYDTKWINDGWIMRMSTTDSEGKTTYANFFNPGIEGVKNMVLQVVTELIDNYDIDGLIIDDYFYPNGIDKTSSAPDYSTYTASGSSLSFADWRRNNINETVKAIYDLIQQHRPDVRFGIGPPGVAGASASRLGFPSLPASVTSGDWQYDGQYTDPLQWLADGSIDFISPQIYWKTTHSTAPFGPITQWWSQCAAQAGRHHYASHSISYIGTSNTTANWEELEAQVELSRQYTLNSAPGYSLYSAKNVNGTNATGLGEHMAANISPCKALNPVVTWKSDQIHTYSAVTNAAKSSAKLTWDAVTDGNRIVRYTVYAVPSDKSLNDVTRSDGDGIQADYLLGVTYTNSYTIPSDKTSDYWYAICVYDGFGNESTPAFVGQLLPDAPQVSLSTPKAKATFYKTETSTVTFSWTAAETDVDNYTLQIGADKNMAKTYKTFTITDNSIDVDITDLDYGTYYWRVVTNKAGYNSTISASTRRFFIAKKDAVAVTLLTPADGTTFYNDLSDNIALAWDATGVEADSYTVQIATTDDFAAIAATKEVTETSVSIAANTLQSATYYWRVVTNKADYNPAYSTTGTFTVEPKNKSAATAASLYYPESGQTFGDVTIKFSWSDTGADTYTVQISTDATFATTTVTKSLTATDWEYSSYALGNGTYYWRVLTDKQSYDQGTSPVGIFKISITSSGLSDEDGYTMITDGGTYSQVNSLGMTSQWIRSIDTGANNFSLSSASNRSFVVVGDYIYLSGRDDNKASYLRRFNRYTGECRGDLSLGTLGNSYDCNSVMKDNKGVVAVSNMTINIASESIKIHKVDLNTGKTTLVATLGCPDGLTSGRVDYTALTGDIDSGNFTVFGAVAATANIIRWTVSDGTVTAIYNKLGSLYPSGTSLGTAPDVIPVSPDDVIIGGQSTHMTRYTLSPTNGGTATLADSFKNAPSDAVPSTYAFNGGTFFTIAGDTFMVFPSASSPYDYKILATDSSMSYKSMSLSWTVPGSGAITLGSTNNKICHAMADHITNDDGSVSVYLYVPCNAIAAYRIVQYPQPATRVSPADATVFYNDTNDKITFSWAKGAGEAESYTLQLANTTGFTEIVKEYTLAGQSMTIAAAELPTDAYYWRVITNATGYPSATSDTGVFFMSTKNVAYAPVTELYYPFADQTFGDDGIAFNWNTVDVDTYTLQVANDAAFSDIVEDTELTTANVTYPSSRFGNGTFYWRVLTDKTACEQSSSEVRKFTISYTTSATSSETGYTIQNDGYTYTQQSGYNLLNHWFRSTSYGNFTQTGSANPGDLNRTFVVVDDLIYMAGRESTASTAKAYLRRYNRHTGECRGDLSLGTPGNSYACNTVMKDGNGNVAIANLILNISSTANKLQLVDLSTGSLTKSLTLTAPDGLTSGRIDYLSVIGDLKAGDFTLFGAVGSTNKIVRWTVKNWAISAVIYNTVSSPSTFDLAPISVPVSTTEVYVSGSATAILKYSISETNGGTATLEGEYGEKSNDNGFATFTHDGFTYIAYPTAYATNTPTPHQFKIEGKVAQSRVKLASGDSGDSAISWTIPAQTEPTSFGSTNSGTYYAGLDYIDNTDGSISVYAYVPGNGIAPYRIADPIQTGIEDVAADTDAKIIVNGRELSTTAQATSIALYNLAGVEVASATGNRLTADVAPGYYVARATINGRPTVKAVVIR